MNTKKVISLKLNYSNPGKIAFLEKLRTSVEGITRDYLDLQFRLLRDEKEHDYSEIRRTTYHEYREKYPDLRAQVVSQTQKWVEERLRSHIQQCKKHHRLVKQPNIRTFPIRLNSQVFTVKEDNRHFEAWIRFNGVHFPLKFPEFAQEIWEHVEKICCSQIIKRRGSFYLELTVEVSGESHDLDPNKKMGVDLNIEKPIVCNDGKIFGEGPRIRHKKIEFQKKRSRAQKNEKRITLKQYRWMKDTNHTLSRQLVDYLISQGVGVLHIENLEGTHLSNGWKRQYSWSFKELLNFIEYKARLAGIEVVYVDPAYTSRTCTHCGLESEDNRKIQSLFECTGCGYRANADVNAARNILRSSAEDGENADPPHAA